MARLLGRPVVAREIVEDHVALLDVLEAPIARLESEIQARAQPDARVQALPGVGLPTAMTLVAEVGDVRRFPSARKRCAWAGLTPRVHNSDRTVRHGHTTKAGAPWLRHVLGEAAQVAKRHPDFADAPSVPTSREAGVAPQH